MEGVKQAAIDVMDFNKILTEWRAGKLSEHGLDDLRSWSAGCVVFIQNRIPEAIHLKDGIDDEIRRKEEAEFQKQADLTASQRHSEALTESREATRFARWSFYAAVAAVAIGIGAWRFPRETPATYPPDAGRSQPVLLPAQQASAAAVVLPTNPAPVAPVTPPLTPSKP